MSETPHLRPVADGEAPSSSVYAPRRFKLSPQEWAKMNDLLSSVIRQPGGTTLGDEVLQFSPGMTEQAMGMTKSLLGVMARSRETYSGMTAGHVELVGENPEDIRPTIFFPGTLAPEEIAMKANRAMAETNLVLEAVQSPLRFPEQ